MIAYQNSLSPSSPIPVPQPHPSADSWFYSQQSYQSSTPATSFGGSYPYPTTQGFAFYTNPYTLNSTTPSPPSSPSPPTTPSKKKRTPHPHNKRNGKGHAKKPQSLSLPYFNPETDMGLDLSDLSSVSSSSSSSSPPLTPSSTGYTTPPPGPRPAAHMRSPSLPTYGYEAKYANSTFQNSPAPKALPKPTFLMDDDDF